MGDRCSLCNGEDPVHLRGCPGNEVAEERASRRERIATAALQGLVDNGSNPEAVAQAAVRYADALIAALDAPRT